MKIHASAYDSNKMLKIDFMYNKFHWEYWYLLYIKTFCLKTKLSYLHSFPMVKIWAGYDVAISSKNAQTICFSTKPCKR